MNRRAFVKQMALLLASGLVTACTPKEQAAQGNTPTTGGVVKPATRSPLSEGLRLVVLHTNDSNGYVEPCG